MIVVTAPTVQPVTGSELPAPVRDDRPPFTYLWRGTDGVEWDLTNGPVRLGRGVTGLGRPVVTHVRRKSAARDGATWGGYTIEPREIGLPVDLLGQDDESLLGLMLAFLAGLKPGQVGTLTLVGPTGITRSIDARYESGAEGAWELDPILAGTDTYPLTLVADDPYFRGTPVRAVFDAGPPPSFFAPPGSGSVFQIAAASTQRRSVVTNPGDVPAPPVWTVRAPFTGFTVGVGEALVSMTLVKPAGGWVVVDMTPGSRRIVDETGANLLGAVTDVRFTPIPAGRDVRLTMSVDGPGAGTQVELEFTPRYETGIPPVSRT